MIDPIQLFTSIYDVAQLIYAQVQLVEANKAQCQRLAERVRIITKAVQGLEHVQDKTQYIDGLDALKQYLNDCLTLIQKFSNKKNWFKEVAKAGTYKERFEELNKSLEQALTQLSLGVVAKQVVDHEQDVKDQSQDMQTLKANQESILQLNKMALEEIQQFKSAQEDHQQLLIKQDEQHELVLKQVESIRALMEQKFFSGGTTKTKPLIKPKYETDFYELQFEQCIGQGSFGKVYKGIWREQDEVAIKVIEGELTTKQLEEFVREVQIQASLRGPYITQFFAACIVPDRACLVMEYMEQGSLREILDRKKLSPKAQKQIALDIIRGLCQLHQDKIYHRDLKSGNVLVNSAGRAKLSDFGLAKVQASNIKTAVQQSQAIAWLAPELFRRGEYTAASDIYSYGVILWEILTGKKPFASNLNDNNAGVDNDGKIINCILSGQRDPIPLEIQKEFRDIIEACWSLNPSQRPDASSLIQKIHAIQIMPSPEEEYALGQKYEREEHYIEARKHFLQAYDRGFHKAGFHLGNFFTLKNRGVEQNASKAYPYYLAAAEWGYPPAMYNLARMLEKGDGCKQNLNEALKWYEKAAALGVEMAKGKCEIVKQQINSEQSCLANQNQTPKLQNPF